MVVVVTGTVVVVVVVVLVVVVVVVDVLVVVSGRVVVVDTVGGVGVLASEVEAHAGNTNAAARPRIEGETREGVEMRTSPTTLAST